MLRLLTVNKGASMNVELPQDAALFVEQLVASGAHPSSNAAIAEGVRLLMSRQTLRAEIQKGIDQLDAGQGIDGEVVFAELREKARKLNGGADHFACHNAPLRIQLIANRSPWDRPHFVMRAAGYSAVSGLL
jgi:antitoxin ParD1/3/4